MHQRKAQSRHFQTFVKQSFMRVKIKRGDMEPDLKGSWGAPVEHQGHRPDSCRWENAAHATKDALHVSFHCCDKVPEIMNSRTRKDSCCLTVSEASVHCHLAWLPRACRKARRGDHTWPMGVEQRKEQGPKVPFKDTPLWQHLFPVALDTSLPKSPTGCWASLSHTGPWGILHIQTTAHCQQNLNQRILWHLGKHNLQSLGKQQEWSFQRTNVTTFCCVFD